MFIAVVVSGILFVGILLLFVMQKRELCNLKEQLREISKIDSNQKLHSQTGIVDGELIEQINRLLDEVRKNRIHFQRRNHEIEQMMTNMSHDLRTPLTSALGYIEMLENEDLSRQEREEMIGIVKKRLLRMNELIDSFFEFSKIISRKEQPKLSELNLICVLEEAISHYYDDYCECGRKVELEYSDSRIMINSNAGMLIRIFDNLIANALRHGEGNLRINVQRYAAGQERTQAEVKATEMRAVLTFTNRIADTQLNTERIFDEFYTTDISRTKGSTGLGLAISKQFAVMLGCEIGAKKLYDELILSLKMPI